MQHPTTRRPRRPRPRPSTSVPGIAPARSLALAGMAACLACVVAGPGAAAAAAPSAPSAPLVDATLVSQQAPTTAQALAGLDDEIGDMLAEWEVPGLAVAVVRDDAVVYAQGFGVREVGGADPVDEHTLFAAGSTSKAFTATAVAMLVDEGKAAWNDLVVDHLPSFRLSDPYITRDLRLRDLMSHNSGLLRGDRIWYASGRSRKEVVHQVRHQPVTFPLRSTFQYNNTTWIAAGEAIEALAGTTWDDFVAERIFRPLGMTRSTTRVGPLAAMDNVASPHVETLEGELRVVPYRNIDNAGPAGSINSSVAEMAQWVRMQLAGGVYEGERLVSEEALRETRTAQMVIRNEGTWALIWPESNFLNYGLGWFLSDYRGLKVVSHGGNIDGMTANVAFVPERNYGFVVLANANGANAFVTALVHRLVDRLEGGGEIRWSEQMLARWRKFQEEARAAQRKVEEGRIASAPPSLEVGAYAGAYVNDMYGEIVVSESEGTLSARFGAGFQGPLEHWHYDVYRAVWEGSAGPGEFFRFELGNDGKVAALHADIEGSVEFARKPPA